MQRTKAIIGQHKVNHKLVCIWKDLEVNVLLFTEKPQKIAKGLG